MALCVSTNLLFQQSSVCRVFKCSGKHLFGAHSRLLTCARELEHYSSIDAYTGETRLLCWEDLNLVANAIRDLFSALSTWEPNGELLLDISIHSPSDSKYLLKYLTFEPELTSDACSSLGGAGLQDKAGHDWNVWSAIGKADRPIYKTFNLIRLQDPSSYIDDAPQDEDSLSDTDDSLSDTDESLPGSYEVFNDVSSDTDIPPQHISNFSTASSGIPFNLINFPSDISTSSSDDMDDSLSEIDNSEVDDSSSDEDNHEEDISESPFWQQVPTVPAITGLLLRQQTRRQWHAGTLQAIFTRLPRLREVFYEPWRPVDNNGRVAKDKGKCCFDTTFVLPIAMPINQISNAANTCSGCRLWLHHPDACFSGNTKTDNVREFQLILPTRHP